MVGGGLRPPSLEVKTWVGVGVWSLGSAWLEGALEGRGLGLGPQQTPCSPIGQGKHWPHSLLIFRSPEGLSPSSLILSLWVGLSWAWEPLPSPSRPSGALVASSIYFPSPPPTLPHPQEPCSQKGPRRAEDQAWDLSRLPGAQVDRGNAGRFPFQSSDLPRISPHPSWQPHRGWASLGVGNPPLPQSPLRGTGPIPPPLLLPTPSPKHPTGWLVVSSCPVPLSVSRPPPVPGRCPSCEQGQTPCPPSLPSWLSPKPLDFILYENQKRLGAGESYLEIRWGVYTAMGWSTQVEESDRHYTWREGAGEILEADKHFWALTMCRLLLCSSRPWRGHCL